MDRRDRGCSSSRITSGSCECLEVVHDEKMLAILSAEVSEQHLYRDVAIKPGLVRAIDLAHPASADTLHDLVGSKPCPGIQRHPA